MYMENAIRKEQKIKCQNIGKRKEECINIRKDEYKERWKEREKVSCDVKLFNN